MLNAHVGTTAKQPQDMIVPNRESFEDATISYITADSFNRCAIYAPVQLMRPGIGQELGVEHF